MYLSKLSLSIIGKVSFIGREKELFFQAELKERLTPTQYLVTQEHQTEKYKKLVKEIVKEV